MPCTAEPHTELFPAGASGTLQREASLTAPKAWCTAPVLSANSTRCLTRRSGHLGKAPLAGGQEGDVCPLSRPALAWPSSSHYIPALLCNSQVARETKTPTSGQVWGGPWLRPPSGAHKCTVLAGGPKVLTAHAHRLFLPSLPRSLRQQTNYHRFLHGATQRAGRICGQLFSQARNV